ncbi:hypothetical protein A9Q75_17990 [Colwellia psychrerythraea]|uniref:Glycosyl transferase group 1 n=1 Tax=Colwellia psychrerythraea TaxID=28229 RepID=A0A1Y5E2F2_COLPS|nr:hypothetical protein A9Q75_17990 [Colwellia psychrerythraea]
MKKVNVLALTLGEHTPSSRFRIRKLIPELSNYGIGVDEIYAKFGSHPPAGFINRLYWLPKTLMNSLERVNKANNYDICFLQKPLVSTLITFEPLIKPPFVFDVDDAIHLGKRGWAMDKIAKKASHVICGNDFLAEHYQQFSDVTILPTAVDTDYFIPSTQFYSELIVGWSGSSSGFKYLYQIEAQLVVVLKRFPTLKIKIVSNEAPKFTLIDPARIIYEKWTSATEVKAIQNFSVGLMPLDDNLWERGKCSYKMLTYMAVGVPVVVSNVGMNKTVMSHGQCGHLVSNADDWIDSISELLMSQTLRCTMGKVGRSTVCEHYSNKVLVPKLAQLMVNLKS